MAALTTISGAAWPTSGAATTGTVGNSNGLVTGLTHVGAVAADMWTGSVATGYLEGADGGAVALRIDAASGASGLFGAAPVAGDVGVSGFWLRAYRTDKTLAAFTSTLAYVNYLPSVYGSTPNISMLGGVVKNATAPATGSGLSMFVYPTSGVASVSCAEMGYVRGMSGVSSLAAATDVVPNIPFETWVYVQVRIVLAAGATGKYELVINGQRVSEATVTTGTTDATVNAVSFALPALTGIKWQIGALSSWRGTGHPSFTTIYHTPENNCTDTVWPVTFSSTSGTLSAYEGENFVMNAVAGGNVAPRPISPIVGIRDKNERICSYIPSGSTQSIFTRRNYGGLQYNEDGWAWIWIRNIQHRYNQLIQTIYIKDTGGTIRAEFRLAANGTITSAAAPVLAHLPTSDRIFDLGFAFHTDGRVRGLLVDNTENFDPNLSTYATPRRTVIPFVMPNVAPQSITPLLIGNIEMYGTAAGVNVAWSTCSGISFHRYLPLFGIDSYVESQHSVTSYVYISYTGITGSPTFTDGVTTVTTNSANGYAQGTVIAHDDGSTAAKSWVLVFSNYQWPTGTTCSVSTGSGSPTLTGCAYSNPTWIGYTALSGTQDRSSTLTETTSTATVKLLTDNVKDPNYCPAGCLCVVPLTGTLRGGLTLTAATGTGARTCTGDIPQVGAYLASGNGPVASGAIYGQLRDAEAAAVMTPYKPTDTTRLAFQCAGLIGRAGKTITQARTGCDGIASCPSILVVVLGGIYNSLGEATTPALAASVAAREANSLVGLAADVTTNDGYFYWEMPTFGTVGYFTGTYARLCFDTFIRLAVQGLGGINRQNRVFISNTGPVAFADGVHYTAAGAASAANSTALAAYMAGSSIANRNRTLIVS